MEGRTQSEARQDFDSQLTPIHWSDLRSTQGESHIRQQISGSSILHKTTQDPARQRFTSRADFSALSFPNHRNNMMTTLMSMKTMTMMIHIQTSMLLLYRLLQIL